MQPFHGSESVFSFRALGAFLAARGALMACACFALVGWMVLDDYGVSPDAHHQRDIALFAVDYALGILEALLPETAGRYGLVLRLLDAVAYGGPDHLQFYGPVAYIGTGHNRFYGPAFELALLAAERVLDLQDSRRIHLLRNFLTHLCFLGAGGYCARLVLRQYGSRCLALCALGLFLLHPRLYAHSFVNTKDIPFLSMYMVALCLAHRALRKDSLAAFALCGAGIGLLSSVRILGVMLFIAVIGLRACDFYYAPNGPARRHVLRTCGLFAAASALTLYAVFPYLWPDPVNRLVNGVITVSQHPQPADDLFRGALMPSTESPPDYVPTWLAITTPPLALLLAGIGVAALLRRVLIQPGTALRNTPVRFELLLLACFVLPLLLVALLESNVYDGWRQMYFLYAPLCLLAVAGLRAVTIALPSRRPWSGGLAGLGLGATLIAAVGIHPHQFDYFNFLVNRATPERLGSQYELDYWGLASRKALDYLRTHQAGSFHINGKATGVLREIKRNWLILPATDRQRIGLDPMQTDFYIQMRPGRNRLAVYAPVITRQVYNNVLYHVITLNLDRADASVAAPYRAAYRAATAAPPAVRAPFDVYLDARAVTYVRTPCQVADTLPKFTLHVTPADPRHLPVETQRHGFENMDFYFFRRGVRFGDTCMATTPLPDYAIKRLQVGQWLAAEDRILWRAEIAVPMAPSALETYRATYAELATVEPDLRSEFDVYVTSEAVFYAKAPCRVEDTAAKFVLHVVPAWTWSLPRARRALGFDNLDFQFDWQGAHFDGQCLARAALPPYAIKQLRVGQFQQGVVWQGEIPFRR